MAVPVFLEANVYFAGFYFKDGASRVLLDLARQGRVLIFATRPVLVEADRNLKKHADPAACAEFHEFLKTTKVRVLPVDLPVLAAALEAKARWFFTLDPKHFSGAALPQGSTLEIARPRDLVR